MRADFHARGAVGRPVFATVVLALTGAMAAWSGTAHAVDLNELVEGWAVTVEGLAGDDGNDAAVDVALTSLGELVVVGYLDGDVDQQDNAYMVKYDMEGNVLWDLEQDAGAIGGLKVDSNDRYYSVALDDSDNIVLSGVLSGDGDTDTSNFYLVRAFTFDAIEDWTQQYSDGLSSLYQQANDVAVANDYVYSVGGGYHNDTAMGRWLGFRNDFFTGAVNLATITHDPSALGSVPDEALGVAAHTTGDFAIVGRIGVSEGTVNDTDWHVRKYDDTGALLWEHTHAGPGDGEDAAVAAAFNTLGQLIVVGYESTLGTGTGIDDYSDLNWFIVKYDVDGVDGDGQVLWTQTFDSGAGMLEAATCMVLDNADDILVGGYQQEEGTGIAHWRVMHYDTTDGAELDEIVWDATETDSVLTGIDYADDRLALAGFVGNATDSDFETVLYQIDSDGDGVADADDGCPNDGDKTEPGICGCGIEDIDTDGDTAYDCDDECPDDPNKIEQGECLCGVPDVDTDGDTFLDCNENCPDDPNKQSVGECGCGIPDDDSDGDGVVGCDDVCAGTPPGTVVDEFGCEFVPGDTAEETTSRFDDDKGDSGCGGCASGSTPAGGAAILLALAVLARRRE